MNRRSAKEDGASGMYIPSQVLSRTQAEIKQMYRRTLAGWACDYLASRSVAQGRTPLRRRRAAAQPGWTTLPLGRVAQPPSDV